MYDAQDEDYLCKITVNWLALYVVSMLPATIWLIAAAVNFP